MALSVGVRIGSKMRIGESNVVVSDIAKGTIITLDVEGNQFTVTEHERTEILPEVFVWSGLEREDSLGARIGRLAVEAPRSISIKRVGE